jgi:hypothetical protein
VFSSVFLRTKNNNNKRVFTTSLTKRGDFAPQNSFYHSTNFSNNATNVGERKGDRPLELKTGTSNVRWVSPAHGDEMGQSGTL